MHKQERAKRRCARCKLVYPKTDAHYPRVADGSFSTHCLSCSDYTLAAERDSRRIATEQWAKLQKAVSKAVSGNGCCEVLMDEFGYSRDDLRRHLEKQFAAGMSWENYAGNVKWGTRQRHWHIDHIIPKTMFLYEDREHAFALSNLRPLWSKENLRKGSRRMSLL